MEAMAVAAWVAVVSIPTEGFVSRAVQDTAAVVEVPSGVAAAAGPMVAERSAVAVPVVAGERSKYQP